MATSLSCKRVETTTLKVCGTLDTDRMIISVDGDERKLSTLLSYFNGSDVDLVLKIKDEEELDPPDEIMDESDGIYES